MSSEGWKATLAIVIFFILLILIGINSSPIKFNPTTQEFDYNDSAQWDRRIP